MEIKWNKSAIKQLLDILEYIEENEFHEYAEKVEKEILTRVNFLPQIFERQQLDRFKLNNDGSYRAFEFDRYRVSFRVISNEIRILHIRHTSRLPRKH